MGTIESGLGEFANVQHYILQGVFLYYFLFILYKENWEINGEVFQTLFLHPPEFFLATPINAHGRDEFQSPPHVS